MQLSFKESYELAHTTPDSPNNLGVVMDYLIMEGYAEGVKEAKAMIGVMSNAWWNTICETAKGKLGHGAEDNMQGARAAQGGGRLGVFTPARGIGANKRHKNNAQGDENRIKNYKDQLKKDKAAERGIDPEARRERARNNKEKRAYNALDDVLKDIRK